MGQRSLSYYQVAARSMSLSWRALLFGAFDPAATVTMDKLSGFAIPQTVGVWIFGFHFWSMVLPQVVEGVATVLAVYVIGARWRGPATGLLSAVAVVSTPLLPAMFGRLSEDCLLTMSLAMALLCWQTSAMTGRRSSLWWCAGWVAIGFQAKMMQAWFLLPALCGALLLLTSLPRPVRWRRAALLAGAAVVFSLSWITVIMLVPAQDRPYIDGSTTDNGFAMVFGYNGFNRLIPDLIPGAVGDDASTAQRTPARSVSPGDSAGGGGGVSESPGFQPAATTAATAPKTASLRAFASDAKLVLPFFLPQIAWWYPPALLGIGLGIAPLRNRLRRCKRPGSGADENDHATTDAESLATATAVAITGWLIVSALFLTVTSIPHTEYLAAIGVPVALAAGYGATEAVRRFRAGTGRGRRMLPILLAAQVLWTLFILLRNGIAPGCVAPAVGLCGAIALAGLMLGPPSRRVRLGTVALACIAVAAAPALFLFFLITRADQVHADPYAGPMPGEALPAGPVAAGQPNDRSFMVATPFQSLSDPHLPRNEQGVADYVRAHPGTRGPWLATDQWFAAEPYILDNGLEVEVFGGFSGTVPHPNVPDFAAAVRSGQTRFVLLDSVTATFSADLERVAGTYEHGPVIALRRWITTNCAVVPPTTYEHGTARLVNQTLYDCHP